MNIVEGDLLKLASQGKFDVIIHGCNCFCTMGAGIALSIKKQYPEAYKADSRTDKGSKDKLGTYTSAEIKTDQNTFTIVNAYTQHHWRGKGVQADYTAIKSVMALVKKDFSGSRIGYPLIGAGLAGGDWEVISAIISKELKGENHTLVKFKP
jgi:O-acetyl-ADP-ribose deacetylase (regulator of RNase III)